MVLLLTFVGLVTALYFTTEALNSAHDLDASQDALKNLLHAASFKFYTSVAGLGGSILLTVVLKYGMSKVEDSFDTLASVLESKVLFVTPESIAFDHYREAGQNQTPSPICAARSHERPGPGRLAPQTPPRSLTSLTASILNSRLNFRLCMTHLRLYETPNLGVHQTGSSSHNGKLRIWRRGNSHSPKFDEPSYIAAELRSGSDFDIAHLPPDGWQPRAESYIRRFTGLKLSSAEFMPPGKR